MHDYLLDNAILRICVIHANQLLSMLIASTNRLPQLRYAWGLLGISAVAALIIQILGKNQASIVIIVLTLIGSVLVFIATVAFENKALAKLPAQVLIWSIVISFVIFLGLLISVVTTSRPCNLSRLLFETPTNDCGPSSRDDDNKVQSVFSKPTEKKLENEALIHQGAIPKLSQKPGVNESDVKKLSRKLDKLIGNLAQPDRLPVATMKKGVNIQDTYSVPVQSATKETDSATTEDKPLEMIEAPPYDISSSKPEFGAYWRHGSPMWDALQSIAGIGNDARVMPWSERCYYCQANRPTTTTHCFSSVKSAKEFKWQRGYAGYNPKDKVWCNPPTSATRIVSSPESSLVRIFWLE
jgi:hypothetical protein